MLGSGCQGLTTVARDNERSYSWAASWSSREGAAELPVSLTLRGHSSGLRGSGDCSHHNADLGDASIFQLVMVGPWGFDRVSRDFRAYWAEEQGYRIHDEEDG